MMRYVRRTFRQWQQEFTSFWGRFNTFYRLVFGIAMAMAMVFTARRQVLDDRHHAVSTLQQELKDMGVPAQVLPPEHDDEVQDTVLLAENLQASLQREQQETQTVLSHYHQNSRDHAHTSFAALTRLIAKHDLMLRSATRSDPLDQFPLARLCQSYRLTGDFTNIYGFLQDVANLKTPCRLTHVALSIDDHHPATDAYPPTEPVTLTLTCIFESFYADF